VRHIVRVGDPAETLLEIARDERVSLISMSTHGRTGIPRWVFGSMAEKMLRASPVPLLLVRSFRPDREGKPVSAAAESRPARILVPIGAGESSQEVIPAAMELARAFGAHLLVLNVCEGHPQCCVPVPELTRAHEKFREAGLTAEPLMRRGDPAEQILEACRQHSADLIAMSTHGRAGVRRWMLGSVAEKVLRHATVPMLVVRSAGSKREKTSRITVAEVAPRG
jgi:nucleotide-binding universal stress UspA family protein